MPETAPRELMVFVERVVRPLPIPLARQKRLRREFLEHLQRIYAEELERDNDPAAALSRTQVRFGDPQTLGRELHSTIRWWERGESWLERMMARGAQESEWRYALRMTTRFILFVASIWIVLMLDHHLFGTEPVTLLKLKVGLAALTFLTCWFSGLLLFGLETGAEWERPQRRWGWIILLSLALLASWPASLALMMKLAGGSWSEYLTPLISSVVGGFLSVAGGTWLGVFHRREMIYRREWSALEIDAA